jgi:hypothetical protein
LGFGGLAQTPNPQSPIPNPLSPIIMLYKNIKLKKIKLNYKLNKKYLLKINIEKNDRRRQKRAFI